MINTNKQRLQHIIIVTLLLIPSFFAFAQKPDIVKPGSPSVNTALLQTGSFVWERKKSNLFNFSGTPQIPDQRFISIKRAGKEIIIEERLNENGKDVVKRKSVLQANTFEPIRAQAETEDFTYKVEFGSKIKGELENYKTGEKEKYNEPVEEKFFIGSSLEILVSILPLKEGYKAFIPQVTFDNGYRTKVMRWEIEKVQELKAPSCRTGEIIDVFFVELRNTLDFTHTYKIVVEKITRRILHVVSDNGISGKSYADAQTDVQPIKAKFDAAEAKAMISQGTSSITGQAYTIDKNMPKGTIFQGPKKIRAPKGSIVMLIPNTPYFKAWLDFNTSLQKKFPATYAGDELVSGCGAHPLPLEVKEQTLLAEVTDNKGSFSFHNLKPGEYHITVQFVATKYTHTTRTSSGSYNISINSDGSGTVTENMGVKYWGSPSSIDAYAFVKIDKDGEIVKVKLKD